MGACVDAYWRAHADPRFLAGGRGRVSWCGFYTIAEATAEVHGPSPDHVGPFMLLQAREPKPACSPIGLGGMCGRGWKERRAFVVRDVRVLGGNYIACDPKDQSELVVPIFDLASGACIGVFDADSYDVGAFSVRDADEAVAMLEHAGLLRRELVTGATVVL
jgi:putative methionine-R-sulfoxide reductase with GAF domain